MGFIARLFGLAGAGQASSAPGTQTSESSEQSSGVDLAQANQHASEVRGDTKRSCPFCGGAGCSSCGCGNC